MVQCEKKTAGTPNLRPFFITSIKAHQFCQFSHLTLEIYGDLERITRVSSGVFIFSTRASVIGNRLQVIPQIQFTGFHTCEILHMSHVALDLMTAEDILTPVSDGWILYLILILDTFTEANVVAIKMAARKLNQIESFWYHPRKTIQVHHPTATHTVDGRNPAPAGMYKTL